LIWKSAIELGITYALVQGSIISILNVVDVVLPEDSSLPETLMLCMPTLVSSLVLTLIFLEGASNEIQVGSSDFPLDSNTAEKVESPQKLFPDVSNHEGH
jgi:hypothetical protein